MSTIKANILRVPLSFVSSHSSGDSMVSDGINQLSLLLLSMAIKGYKMPLEAKDLWSLNLRDTSKMTVPKLLREWDKELSKARRSVLKLPVVTGHVGLFVLIMKLHSQRMETTVIVKKRQLIARFKKTRNTTFKMHSCAIIRFICCCI